MDVAQSGEKRDRPWGYRRPKSEIEPVLRQVGEWLQAGELKSDIMHWLTEGGLGRRTAERYISVVLERWKRSMEADRGKEAALFVQQSKAAAKEARAAGLYSQAAQHMRLAASILGILTPETQVNVAVAVPQAPAAAIDLGVVSQLTDEEMAVLRKVVGKARGALPAAPGEAIEAEVVPEEEGEE